MDISIEPDGADLQQSIDSLVRAGGGTLLLQPGRHITGPIRLFSGVTLSIGLGATLEFVPDYELYAGNSVSVIAEGSDRAYIVAQEAHDVAIVGDGKILASGAAFSTGFDQTVGTYTPSEKRPRVLVFEDCSKIRLEGFVIEDSPMWTVHLVRCRDVVVESITVLNNRQLPNTDGIVIDSCAKVAVRRCHHQNGGRWRLPQDEPQRQGHRTLRGGRSFGLPCREQQLRIEDRNGEFW